MNERFCKCGYYFVGEVCLKCGRIYDDEGNEVNEIPDYDYRAGLDFDAHDWDNDDTEEMV